MTNEEAWEYYKETMPMKGDVPTTKQKAEELARTTALDRLKQIAADLAVMADKEADIGLNIERLAFKFENEILDFVVREMRPYRNAITEAQAEIGRLREMMKDRYRNNCVLSDKNFALEERLTAMQAALEGIKRVTQGPHDGPGAIMASGEAWSIADAALSQKDGTQDNQEAVDALTFPKVSVRQGDDRLAGYLTEISAKMILAELKQRGFMLVKRG